MSKRMLRSIQLPLGILGILMLGGCKEWKVVSVSPPTFPGNCQIGQDLFDEPQGSSVVPRWTGHVQQGTTCATVSVQLAQANPASQIPDDVTVSVTFGHIPASSGHSVLIADYTMNHPPANPTFNVVGFLAASGTADAAINHTEGFPLEISGTDVESTKCTIYLGNKTIHCD